MESATPATGQDVGIFIRDQHGKETQIPSVVALTLRVEGRRAIATCEIEVDDVDVVGAMLDAVHRAPKCVVG